MGGGAFSIRLSNTQLMTANSTCDDLSASAFSILGSLNDSREIKKLGGKTQDGKINIPEKTVVWQWKKKN